MQDSCDMGLRERKRVATKRAIEEAAVDIAFNQGYQAATAEAISAQAGVSLRTFFNYFANKDTAIAGKGLRVTDRAHATELLIQSEPHLLKGILRIFEHAASADTATSETLRRRRALYKTYPTLLHHYFNSINVFETQLSEVVSSYLAQRPEQRRLAGRLTGEEEARLAVTMFGSAIRYSVRFSKVDIIGTAARVRDIEQTIDLMADFRREIR